MKKFTSGLKMLALFCLLALTKTSLAQGCAPTFTPSNGANGNVTFNATPPAGATVGFFFWVFGYNNATATTPSTTISYNYPTNGIYTVTCYYNQTSPVTCSAVAVQTIMVSNASNCNLVAGFNYNNTPTFGAVDFNSISTGTVPGVSYTWNYGDGSSAGSGATSSHTYAAGGNYQVKLIVDNNTSPACVDSVMMNVFVCGIAANFSMTTGTNGGINVSSTSVGTVSNTAYVWNWGDVSAQTSGQGASYASATHSYVANGTYTVTLSIFGSGCFTSSMSYTVNINNVVQPCNLIANFGQTFYPNGAMSFANYSSGTSGGVTYSWAFGDGGTSSSASPTHTYASNGVYTCTLTANNNYSYSCTSTMTMNMIITTYCNLAAGFTYSVNPGGVIFTNTSTGAFNQTTYLWDFGDGSSYFFGPSPTHPYLSNGTYTVTLNASSPGPATCTSTAVQVITISGACAASAGFSMSPSGTPQIWNATPLAPGSVTAATWAWGDGSTSNTLYTSHTYSAAGLYSICLTVTTSCGATDTYCGYYSINRSSQDQSVVQINVIDPAATVGIKSNPGFDFGYSLAPNPNNGNFNLSLKGLNESKVSVSVFNTVGALVYKTDSEPASGNFEKNIQLDQVSTGMYFVKVNVDNSTFTKKLIINKQ